MVNPRRFLQFLAALATASSSLVPITIAHAPADTSAALQVSENNG